MMNAEFYRAIRSDASISGRIARRGDIAAIWLKHLEILHR